MEDDRYGKITDFSTDYTCVIFCVSEEMKNIPFLPFIVVLIVE